MSSSLCVVLTDSNTASSAEVGVSVAPVKSLLPVAITDDELTDLIGAGDDGNFTKCSVCTDAGAIDDASDETIFETDELDAANGELTAVRRELRVGLAGVL
jgi:hypothetical protein